MVKPRPKARRGIALILVMWVLTLLTIMAVGLTVSQRTEIALAEAHVESARLRALAEAAIAYTALHYGLPETQGDAEEQTEDGNESEDAMAWWPDGQPRSWSFAGTELELRVFNEASRYSLNRIAPETLQALLEVLGLAADEARALAAAIVDWRDEDDLALLNGAEDADYLQAGRAFGAKDAPYETVEELRQVLGMTPEIYRQLAPEVSVDSDEEPPVERFASPAVLATLKGITLKEARAEIEQRDSRAGSDRGGPLYRLQIRESHATGTGQGMEVLLRIEPGQPWAYQVLWRRQGIGRAPPQSDLD